MSMRPVTAFIATAACATLILFGINVGAMFIVVADAFGEDISGPIAALARALVAPSVPFVKTLSLVMYEPFHAFTGVLIGSLLEGLIVALVFRKVRRFRNRKHHSIHAD